jgi:transcription elongation GreA/GreB family factor
MSRAFVKESDRIEPLPEIPLSEHPNHTTPAGLLRQQQRLAVLRAGADENAVLEDEAAQQAAAREMRWLEARIASAIVVDPAGQPADRVAFGATVDVIDEHGVEATYRIVGEDETDAEHGSVSWLSPLARAVLGAKVGDEVTWRRPAGDLRLEILAIRYDA